MNEIRFYGLLTRAKLNARARVNITQDCTSTNTIDAVGKVSEKTIIGQNGDMTNSKTAYTYDPTDKLLRKIKFEDFTAGNFTNYNYDYDDKKRPNFNDESGYQSYFQQAKQYDGFGRVERELFTAINTSDSKRSDKWVKYTYKNGYQHQIIDNDNNKVLRETKTVNARGQLTSAQNNHTQETHTFNAFGYQTGVNHLNISGPNYSNSATAFLSLNTNFDNQRGNLLSRSNPFATYQENFTYDTQDRLLTYPNETGVTQIQSYDVAGKITANNIGDYAYTNVAKPYQLTSITPVDQTATSAVLNYYTNRTQDIKYNVFKSPVSIMEESKENAFFEYNTFNQRSTMYYGGLQTDKNLLPFRKFYNADGTMEIKRTLSGGVEFTTYIGGDAYSAPLMLKSNGTTQNYLYLCRDYQGSIIAITDADGLLLQKRFFDAWGKMSHFEQRVCPVASCPMQASMPTTAVAMQYTDRGYTGHEMLLGLGLINMNARLYDPKLHRFLAPDNFVQDPSNTQSFNRYGYCWNNPLKFTDPSGEIVWMAVLAGAIIGASTGAATYIGTAIRTGDWNWGQFGMAVLGGAIIGALTSGTLPASLPLSQVFGTIAGGFISGLVPPVGIQLSRDFSISISPSIAFGNSTGIGASLSVTHHINGEFSYSFGVGIMSNGNYNGMGKNGLEVRQSFLMNYDDGKTGASLGFNEWSGGFDQRTGMFGIHSGDFRAMYENDGGPGLKQLNMGDGGDSFRTAALNLSIGKFSAGFNLFTGQRSIGDQKKEDKRYGFVDSRGIYYKNPATNEQGARYRLGALTVGYEGYRIGVNSEHVRHAIQNSVIHRMIGDNEFISTSWDWKSYIQYRTPNTFTSW